MNVFGGATSLLDKGPRGPPGPRGKDGTIVDLCTWMPNSVIRSLHENDESGAFFIENLDKDIIRSSSMNESDGTDITQWVSRSVRGGNMIAKKPSKDVEKIEDILDTDRYALKFKTAHYYASQSPFLLSGIGTCGFICITFRTDSESEQVLLCGSEPSHHHQPPIPASEIKISGATEITIQIHSVKEIIQFPLKGWITLFVEYNADNKLSHFTYDVNGTMGSFTAPSSNHAKLGLHLGCRYDDTRYFDGQIASLETYSNYTYGTPLPDSLKDIVIQNQKI